jgi:hypothetical protein
MHSKLKRLGLSAALILALLVGAGLPALAETPPTANDDTADTVTNQAVGIDVADNDIAGDNDLDLASIVVLTDPTDGTAAVGTGGVITYTPDVDYYGTDSFMYEIADGNGYTDTATVAITVYAPPVAEDETAETEMNQAAAVDVADNDSDADGTLDLTSIVVVTGPADGTTEVGADDGVITYTPDVDYYGTDSFVYEIADNDGYTDTATVDVTVYAPPAAEDDTAKTEMNQAVAIDVADNDSDADGTLDLASIVLVTDPANGTTEVGPNDGVITYTPDVDCYGTDSFVYEIADNDGYTDTATAGVTVHALPIAEDDTVATGEGQPMEIDVLANDAHYDPEGTLDATSVTVVSAPSDGTTEVDGVTGVITYTPDAEFSGTDSFEYQVADTAGRTDSAQVTITVEPAPVIASLSPESVIMRAQGFEITVSGDHFASDSIIVWNAGEPAEQQLSTTFVDVNTLTATIASDLVENVDAGIPIHVENPEYGLVSNAQSFVVEGPQVRIDPDSAELVDGETVTVDIRASAKDLYALQLKLSFDSSVVSVPGGMIDLGSLWTGRDYDVLQNSVNNAAGEIELAVSLKNPEDPVYVEDAQLATITFEFEGPGTTALELTEAILSNRDGLSLEPVDTTEGSLHAKGTVCAYGVVELQGRPGNWAGATVTIAGGPGGTYTFETGSDGQWQICDITEGTYDISVDVQRYLGSQKTSESLTHAIGSDFNFGHLRLLGGDIADGEGGTGDGEIDISDATALATDFNVGNDERTDINQDSLTNILDAAILGGNWAMTAPVTW